VCGAHSLSTLFKQWPMYTNFGVNYTLLKSLTSCLLSTILPAIKNSNMALTSKGKGKGRVHPRTDHEGTQWEYRYSSTLSLTSAVDRSEYSTPRSGSFTPGRRACTHCTGRWVRPWAGLDGCGKSHLHRDLIQPVTNRYTDYVIPAHWTYGRWFKITYEVFTLNTTATWSSG
jgi:hypothetical protein